MSSLPATSTRTDPTREETVTRPPLVETTRREVVGMHEQVVARSAAGEPGRVVEPRVVVLLVPSPDQHQRVVGLLLGPVAEPGAQAVEITDEQRRRQVDPVVSGLQAAGHGRAERAEVDALGMSAGAAPG